MTNQIIKSIQQLLSIESVKSPPEPDKPFGDGIYRALSYYLSLAKSMGFETVNYDNYIGEVVYGKKDLRPCAAESKSRPRPCAASGKDKRSDLISGDEIAILCHLDTVPAGGGWTYPPFAGTLEGGKIYGRGATDDKSAAIICLFALKRLKDEGFIPDKTIKLIVGCDEESGWACIEHYKKCAKLPEYGFSPDADFPVIYAEKGILHIEAPFKTEGVQSFSGGSAANMVCDYAEAVCEILAPNFAECGLTRCQNVLESRGSTAHGSTPEKGRNALDGLVKYLSINKMIEQKAYGFLFGQNSLRKLSDQTGDLTMSADMVRLKDNKAYFTIDIRYPATMDKERILSLLSNELDEYTVLSHKAPLYSGEGSPLVNKLLKVYNEVMETDLAPVAIGGGTYARALKCGVAFGPEFPGEPSTVHQKNEYIAVKNIDTLYEIYYRAIKELTFSE